MKKYLFPLIAGLGLAAGARGALVLDETFTYADGALTNVSGGIWANHSGTTPIQVVGEKAVISQANNGDNFAQLTGAPYSSGNLYASFVVNFSTVPTSGGTYFAHFKDATTSGFRCRAFAVSTGAAAGNYRVGIARASGAAVIIPTDLAPNTDYLLVMRYDAATGASRLWINPGSEGTVTDLADGSDAWTLIPITSFGLRQGANNQGICTLDDLKVGTAFSDVVSGGDPTLNPPFISNISAQSIPKNGVTPSIPFYVTDGETPHGSLFVAATASSNPVLVPLGNVAISGNVDSNRTVTVTPATGEQGFSEITLTVTDEHNNTATRSFLVVVGAPTISSIADQETPKDVATPAISFTVGDVEGDTLTITAASSNEFVVPISGIAFDGAGPNRTVTITPAAGVSGLSRITVLVSDGFNTASNRFVVTVYPYRSLDLCDTFSYPDGSVVTNSSFFWNTHSGANGETPVTNGAVVLSGSRGEDISAFMTNSYFRGEGWIIYSHFKVNFITRPTSGSGEYFAHFKDAGTFNFGGRIFALTNGAAAGKLRLGIANNAASPSAVLPTDLETNKTYTVVTRYNIGTGQSRLWVDPATESDTAAVATDSPFTLDVLTYAFRQTGFMGSMIVDDVKVGSAFADVTEPRLRITLNPLFNEVEIRYLEGHHAQGYRLESTTTLPGGWGLHGIQGAQQGADRVLPIAFPVGATYFRLAK